MRNIKTAFDFGNSSIKIVALKKGVLHLYEIPMPENIMENDTISMPNAFSAFLKKIKADLRLPSGPAALILPSSQVICRLVTMPHMTVEQLMLNLPYEFNDFIQGEVNQYFCDYALCDEMDRDSDVQDETKEMTMMASIAEKQNIQDYIKIFSSAGFSLRLILPQEMAFINIAQYNKTRGINLKNEYCFIDLGQLSTRVFIVNNDRIQATRQIPIGMKDLDVIIADILNIDIFLSDAYKRNNYMNVLAEQRCMELYEHIAIEILKLINFYHFTYRQNQLLGIYIIGGGANISQLVTIIEETVGLPAMPVSELIPDKTEYKNLYHTCMRAMALTFTSEWR